MHGMQLHIYIQQRQGIYLKTVAFGGILLTALIAFLILNMNKNI